MVANSAYPVRLGPQGRVVIPAPIRKALGLRSGDTLLCGAAEDRLVLELRVSAELRRALGLGLLVHLQREPGYEKVET